MRNEQWCARGGFGEMPAGRALAEAVEARAVAGVDLGDDQGALVGRECLYNVAAALAADGVECGRLLW